MAPRPLRHLALCSGYGGFSLALHLALGRDRVVDVAHVERDSHAAAVLVARMAEATLDPAPVWDDLETFDGAAWRGRVDIITAGFPCQPWSQAGRGGGVDDERWIWPAIARLVGDVRPRFVFLENVTPLVARGGLGLVLADLARLGFDAEWECLSAGGLGAPHQRQRVWILAHPDRDGLEGVGTGPEADPRNHAHRSGGADVAHAGCSGGSTLPGSAPRHEGRDWAQHDHVAHGPVEDVADPAGVDEREPDDEARPEPRRDAWPDPRRIGGSVADAEGERCEGRRCGRGAAPLAVARSRRDAAWPPGPDDTDGWAQWTAQGGPEPGLRRGAHGRPAELVERLHLLGNGLVPVVAAAALIRLGRRRGWLE